MVTVYKDLCQRLLNEEITINNKKIIKPFVLATLYVYSLCLCITQDSYMKDFVVVIYCLQLQYI